MKTKSNNNNKKVHDYIKQSSKYFEDGKKLLRLKDFAQASEKLWGAAATIVKAVAEHQGITHDGHSKLFKIVDIIAKKSNDSELLRLFRLANSLHINFYENWLTPDSVIQGKEDVEEFVKRMKRILSRANVKNS